uniref:(northern house mosquito) hypothetical protein n=1 Tax=Culex pipiens TaxID=7175 RepID=A0A8D7ZZF0_CULPI
MLNRRLFFFGFNHNRNRFPVRNLKVVHLHKVDVHLSQNRTVITSTPALLSKRLLSLLEFRVHHLGVQLRGQIQRRRTVLGPFVVGPRRIRKNIVPNGVVQRSIPLILPPLVLRNVLHVRPVDRIPTTLPKPNRVQEKRTANRQQQALRVRQAKRVRERLLHLRSPAQRINRRPTPLDLARLRMRLNKRLLLFQVHRPVFFVQHLPMFLGDLLPAGQMAGAFFVDDLSTLAAPFPGCLPSRFPARNLHSLLAGLLGRFAIGIC